MSAVFMAQSPVRPAAPSGKRTDAVRAGSVPPSPGLRLTRRGRMFFIGVPVVLLAAAVLIVLGFFNSPATAADTDQGLDSTATITYTVAPGDTVWMIADVVAAERDTRDVVQAIMDLNGLTDSTIHSGQQLFVPTET